MKLKFGFKYNFIIGLSLLFCSAFTESRPIQLEQSSTESLSCFLMSKAVRLVTGFSLGLGAAVLSTVAHECGHAFMAKILYGYPLNINLGGYSNQSIKSKIGFVTIRGWDPFIGSAMTGKSSILKHLAGPCLGTTIAIVLSKLSENPLFKLICFYTAIKNIQDLYPVSFKLDSQGKVIYSDGGRILKKCIGKKKADKIITVLSHPLALILLSTIKGLLLAKMSAQEFLNEIQKK